MTYYTPDQLEQRAHYEPEDWPEEAECENCGRVAVLYDLRWTMVCAECRPEAEADAAWDRYVDEYTKRAENGFRDA